MATKKKSKKFEHCVLAVKKSQRKRGAKRVNPWAVCHAALGKKKAKRDPASWRVQFPSHHRREPGKVVSYSSKSSAMQAAKSYSAQHHGVYVDVMRGGITVMDFYNGKSAAGKGGARDPEKDYVLMYG